MLFNQVWQVIWDHIAFGLLCSVPENHMAFYASRSWYGNHFFLSRQVKIICLKANYFVFQFFFFFGRSQSKTLEYQNRCVSCHIWWSGWTQRWSPQYSMYLRTVCHSFSSFSCFLCFPFLSFHFPHHLIEPINIPFGFLKNIKIEMQSTASLGLGQFHCILLSLVVIECCDPLNILSKFSL